MKTPPLIRPQLHQPKDFTWIRDLYDFGAITFTVTRNHAHFVPLAYTLRILLLVGPKFSEISDLLDFH